MANLIEKFDAAIDLCPFLPEEKGDYWVAIPVSLFLVYAVCIADNSDGFLTADLSMNNVKSAEIYSIDYKKFDGGECINFRERNTNTNYQTCREAKKIDYALAHNFDRNNKGKIEIDFLTFKQYRDKTSRTRKSHYGVVLKVSQGEKLLFKRPNNYFETLEKIRKEEYGFSLWGFCMQCAVILHLIAVLRKTSLLLKED